jgi:hypothetical protein
MLINGHNIYHYFPFQGPQKSTQIGIFGLKIYHLATLGSCTIAKKKAKKSNVFSVPLIEY